MKEKGVKGLQLGVNVDSVELALTKSVQQRWQHVQFQVNIQSPYYMATWCDMTIPSMDGPSLARNTSKQNSWAQILPVSSQATGTHRQTTFDFISHGPGRSGPGADANGGKSSATCSRSKANF